VQMESKNRIDFFMSPPRSLAVLTAVLPIYSCAKQDGNHTSLEEVQVRVLRKGRGVQSGPDASSALSMRELCLTPTK